MYAVNTDTETKVLNNASSNLKPQILVGCFCFSFILSKIRKINMIHMT